MIKRRPKGTFGSYTVFPGGVVAKDDHDLKITALRETMEETGLLLTKDIKSLDIKSRNQIDQLAIIDMDTIRYMSTWITPPNEKYRFHTTFYLKIVSELPHCIPDGIETVDIYFKSIPELLLDFRNGIISLMPPQWILLNVLNGDISNHKFTGIIDPEQVYESDTERILALPGDYQHSKSSNRQFRIVAKLKDKLAIDYALIDSDTLERNM